MVISELWMAVTLPFLLLKTRYPMMPISVNSCSVGATRDFGDGRSQAAVA